MIAFVIVVPQPPGSSVVFIFEVVTADRKRQADYDSEQFESIVKSLFD